MFVEGVVVDLVVVLQKQYEGVWCQVGIWFVVWLVVVVGFVLVDEVFGQVVCQVVQWFGVVLVVVVVFVGEQDVQCMVVIVVLLCVVVLVQQVGVVVVVFQDQVQMVFGVGGVVQVVGYFDEECVIGNCVYGIEVQVVDVIVEQLYQGVFIEEFVDFVVMEIDGLVLGCLLVVVEECGGVLGEVVVVWVEVVVDYVDEDYQVYVVSVVDQMFELFGCVVG